MSPQPPYHNLPSAYYLHYYFLFQTRRNRPVLTGNVQHEVKGWIQEICSREDYHPLGLQMQETRLEVLLSLKPSHSIAKVAGKIKANVSRHLFLSHPGIETLIGQRHLWGRSYKVESTGAASTAAIKAYLDSQREHHNVVMQIPRQLLRYSVPDKESYREFRHKGRAVYLLNHHYVFSVKGNLHVIDEGMAQYLTDLFLKVCEVKGYELLSLEILDEHVHAIVSLRPKDTPQEVAEALMNNTSFLALRRFPQLQRRFPNDQLWTPGFFVRSVGNRTTAQVKFYLQTW
jgi:putative transposase